MRTGATDVTVVPTGRPGGSPATSPGEADESATTLTVPAATSPGEARQSATARPATTRGAAHRSMTPSPKPAATTRGEVDLSAAARLIGEPARAAMLDALLAGRALAAGELARVAGVSPGTASEHLSRLRDGGLVEVVAAGRHRYYRLSGPEVAHAMEALAMISPVRPVRTLRQSRADASMIVARTCYDHLAGRLGVAIHDAMVDGGGLAAARDGYELTAAGERMVHPLGVDVAAARARRRSFARPCLDFTERRTHLAGALGAAICGRLLDTGWVVHRTRGHRGLRVTEEGRRGLSSVLGVRLEA